MCPTRAPSLPPELELRIFELAADLDPGTIPVLLRVAQECTAAERRTSWSAGYAGSRYPEHDAERWVSRREDAAPGASLGTGLEFSSPVSLSAHLPELRRLPALTHLAIDARTPLATIDALLRQDLRVVLLLWDLESKLDDAVPVWATVGSWSVLATSSG
ncbi:unnamed protein product [Mycena citricolor]|uniref:F-box domain-containing protein n=1 Tax=Mycena citricolor TaxID=2018698 RepID=A0AAD2HYI4_9AGAR|nr:unnamed protein product [Mycena citricolor]